MQRYGSKKREERTIKRIIFLALAIAIIAPEARAQQGDGPRQAVIGLTARLDYYSTYLWRGTYSYGGDGAFLPSLSYDILRTGAVVSFIGEFSESYFFEGEKSDRNQTAFAAHGLNFGLDYSRTLDSAVTLGAALWYYWYFNSSTSDAANRTDYTFLMARGYVKMDSVPLTPVLAVNYDYYTAIRRGGDFYVTLGVSHEFALADSVSLALSLGAGYYYQNTAKTTTYAGSDVIETPVKKGFSDITALAILKFSQGRLGISAGFGYIAVPAETWHKGQDIHRFYATFGASLTL